MGNMKTIKKDIKNDYQFSTTHKYSKYKIINPYTVVFNYGHDNDWSYGSAKYCILIEPKIEFRDQITIPISVLKCG